MNFFHALPLMALTLFGACATEPTPPPRQGEFVLDWPQDESDLRPDPNIRYGRLSNGFRYALVHSTTPSGAISFRLRFKAGSLNEDEDQRGLAHFLEHMAFNGSTHVPEGDMPRLLERQGLIFGAHANASTSFEETIYRLDAPNTRDETVDTILMLLREVASELTLDSGAIDRERGIVLSEARARDDATFRASQAALAFLFGESRAGRRMPIGTPQVIATAPAHRLRDFYHAYYRPDRALLVAVGEFEVDALEQEIIARFSNWTASAANPGPVTHAARFAADRVRVHVDPEAPTTLSMIHTSAPERVANTSADVERAFLRSIGNRVLTRRLARLASAENAPIMGAEASSQQYYDELRLSSIDLQTPSGRWRDGVAVAEQELRRAIDHGFLQHEIDEQVALIRNQMQRNARQAGTRTNADIAGFILAEFSAWGVAMSPADARDLAVTILDRITAHAINAAFREQWRGRPRFYLTSSEPIDVDEVLQAHARSQSVNVGPPPVHQARSFAYQDFGPAGAVVERGRVEDLDIHTFRFANNVLLNVKATNYAADRVLVTVRFGAGNMDLPSDRAGFYQLIHTWTDAGLEAHSSDDLRTLLAGRAVSVEMNTASDAFQMNGAASSDDLLLQLQLMTAYLMHPGFRAEALSRFRQSEAEGAHRLAASPQGVAQRDLPRVLRSGDLRWGMASVDEIERLSYQDVRQVLDGSRLRGPLEIGVVGDVDPEQVAGLIARTFGALPERAYQSDARPTPRPSRFPRADAPGLVLRHQGPPDRASALIYWPTDDDTDTERMRQTDLLRAVLSLKLIEQVRERDGGSYAPRAETFHDHASPGYGYLGVSIDLRPTDVERLLGLVEDIAAQMRRGDISMDELNRARTPLLEQSRIDEQTNSYWRQMVASAQTDPRRLEAHRRLLSEYESTNVDDLTALARRYLDPRTRLRIVILPDGE